MASRDLRQKKLSKLSMIADIRKLIIIFLSILSCAVQAMDYLIIPENEQIRETVSIIEHYQQKRKQGKFRNYLTLLPHELLRELKNYFLCDYWR